MIDNILNNPVMRATLFEKLAKQNFQ